MFLKKAIKRLLFEDERNLEGINGPSIPKTINLEWFDGHNIGDYLSKIIYEYMLEYYNLDTNTKTKKTMHISAVGSVLGCFNADTTVWGTGLLSLKQFKYIINNRQRRKLDIRAVRGPVTRAVLCSGGYDCPENYGDPAILLPLIYNKTVSKKYKISYIPHISQQIESDVHIISTDTENYRFFIDEIRQSEVVVSSSLHGIIIAETYGVPAIFLNSVPYQLCKFFDWYYSTGRYDIKICKTIDEAIQIQPMQLPDLVSMREKLISLFPVDLWD